MAVTSILRRRRQFWKWCKVNGQKSIVIAVILIFIASRNRGVRSFVNSILCPPKEPVHFKELSLNELSIGYDNETSLMVNTREADVFFHKVRVLCLIPTIQKHIDQGRINVVNKAWSRKCNKIFYVLCPRKDQDNIINTCMFKDTKEHLLSKMTFALFRVYQKHLYEFDWILKADDDTYVVMENLRLLLSSYNSGEAGYLGFHFKTFLKQGYNSGGASYAISRRGLKQVIEEGYDKGYCAIYGMVEDLEIGRCLEIANVPMLSSVDKFGRQTFHTEDFFQHITGSIPKWLVIYSRENIGMGTECCSQFVISFHHLDMYSMIVLHQLLFRTSVYGHKLPSVTPDEVFPPRIVKPQEQPVIP